MSVEKVKSDYDILCDLQSECKLLTLGSSVRLTGYIMDNDAIKASILLLKLMIKHGGKEGV